MKRNITFREYRKEDKQYLEDIIRKTWEYVEMLSTMER